jgi:hypothetical protein
MASNMTFFQKLSAYSLGFITDKDLPDVAMTGLQEGYDSESLRILAGHNTKDNLFVLNDYFRRALIELRVVLNDKKESLITVVAFYARNIVDKKVDTYLEFEKLNEIITKTGFHCADIGLNSCYAEYISIWEEKMDGLDFHTADGIPKEKYIEKTEENIRNHLQEWLIVNGGT